MNPAIEKLEKEIEELKYELIYNADMYERLEEFNLEQKMESLKACVEALEETEWANRSGNGRFCPCCFAEKREGHTRDCKIGLSKALVNRAMGVSQ